MNLNSTDFVNDILKDSKGRVWIGAQIGFYRYDGAHFLEYRKTNDSGSLVNNFIHGLCEDKSGNIWGGTERGAFCFSPETQKFRNYFAPLVNSPQSITNIVCENDGTIWATTPYHILRFNALADSFEMATPIHPNPDSLQANNIKGKALLADPKTKGIWVATRSGLKRFDIRTKKLQDYRTDPGSVLFRKGNAGALAKTSDGAFMFFDNVQKEIVQFDPVRLRILRRISLKRELPNAIGITLFESKDSKIWFSSWSDEVVMIDQKNGDLMYSLHTPINEPLSLPSNRVWDFMQDEDGTIWIGTSAGISICNPGKSLFRIHRLGKQVPILDEQTSFYGFVEDPNDYTWWLLTSKNQIIQYNPLDGTSKVKDISYSLPDKKGRRPTYIRGINIFYGKLAVSSMEGTWLWMDGKSPFMPLESVIKSDLPFTIRRMIGMDQDNYYMSDFNQIISWNNVTRTTKIIPTSNRSLFDSTRFIEPKVNYQANRPFFGNYGKGYIFKINEDSLRTIQVVANPRDIHSAYINDIDGDLYGNIWVCHTGGGLIQYRSENKSTKVWDETNGLSFNQVMCVSLDNSNNAWCVFKSHFSVLLAKTETFYNFSVPIDPKKDDWENFMYTIHNGNIIANNFNSIIEFFPNRLLLKPQIKLPQISSLHVNGKLVAMRPGNDFELNPDQNDILIRFGLLTDKTLFPYKLKYKLDGADNDWKTAGETSEAVYNKLPPGNYTFRVKAFAQNGEWQTGENFLSIEILNPFYLTTWFILLSAGTILSIFFAIYRYRLQQHKQIFNLETKSASLEREKATIQYDSLKQQLNPHFLFNSLTSLAGLIEADQEMASGFLQHMSDMYRYILKNGEQETVLLKDELKFARFYIDIQQTRFGKGFSVLIDVPEEYGNFRIAPVTLQNLVENAIKHNVIDPDAPLQIRIYPEDEYLVVSNNLQKKHMVETSNKTGLVQFISLYKYLSEKPVLIEETMTSFVVKIPLV